jgi:hypothetical protein
MFCRASDPHDALPKFMHDAEKNRLSKVPTSFTIREYKNRFKWRANKKRVQLIF